MVNAFEQSFTRHSERPFNSEHKFMAISGVHGPSPNPSGREMFYIKGSIDGILDRCKFYYVSEESTPGLDASTRNVISLKANATASRGLRVIAMAYGFGPVDAAVVNGNGSGESKKNLVFVGFEAMIDPPRKGVADSIGLLQNGGVQVVMITGDAEPTALSIARKLGLRVGGGRVVAESSSLGGGTGNASCLTGKAIDLMSKGQLKERVGSVSVFARTTPRHKMAIVEAFQARGDVVAMTGDGGMVLIEGIKWC
jgi:Ca2+-transporting ATPase